MRAIDSSQEETAAMFGNRTNGAYETHFESEAAYHVEAIIDKVTFSAKKPPTVDVFLVNGVYIAGLVWQGGFIDPDTKELHGDWIPPVPSQKVMVGFSGGDTRNAYISCYLFRSALSEDMGMYVDFKTDKLLKKDSVYRGHRSGGMQHFSNEKIETGFSQEVDSDGVSMITQTPGGIELGAGGLNGHKQIAVIGSSDENFVLTAFGPQPILAGPSRLSPNASAVKV